MNRGSFSFIVLIALLVSVGSANLLEKLSQDLGATGIRNTAYDLRTGRAADDSFVDYSEDYAMESDDYDYELDSRSNVMARNAPYQCRGSLYPLCSATSVSSDTVVTWCAYNNEARLPYVFNYTFNHSEIQNPGVFEDYTCIGNGSIDDSCVMIAGMTLLEIFYPSENQTFRFALVSTQNAGLALFEMNTETIYLDTYFAGGWTIDILESYPINNFLSVIIYGNTLQNYIIIKTLSDSYSVLDAYVHYGADERVLSVKFMEQYTYEFFYDTVFVATLLENTTDGMTFIEIHP